MAVSFAGLAMMMAVQFGAECSVPSATAPFGMTTTV
jgi:hypothetical protein